MSKENASIKEATIVLTLPYWDGQVEDLGPATFSKPVQALWGHVHIPVVHVINNILTVLWRRSR